MVKEIPTKEPLYSCLGADPELAEIVEMFVQELPNRIAVLLDQLDASNWGELCRTVHQLKGAAGSYGFDAITSCAERLEDVLRQDVSFEKICEMVDALVEMCNRVRTGTPGEELGG